MMKSNNILVLISSGIILLVGFFMVYSTDQKQTTKAADNTVTVNNATEPQAPKTIRIGLQAGHWENDQLPDELANLRANGTGTTGGGKDEWEVNLNIANLAAEKLRANGFIVDVLPATIPPGYQADVFVAIHADGSLDPASTGFKVAASSFDQTGQAQDLAKIVESAYQNDTNLSIDPNVTDDMREYYAFHFDKYQHTISSSTPAMIIETGFLTSPSDQTLLINNQNKVAQGIADGVVEFLSGSNINSST